MTFAFCVEVRPRSMFFSFLYRIPRNDKRLDARKVTMKGHLEVDGHTYKLNLGRRRLNAARVRRSTERNSTGPVGMEIGWPSCVFHPNPGWFPVGVSQTLTMRSGCGKRMSDDELHPPDPITNGESRARILPRNRSPGTGCDHSQVRTRRFEDI